MRRSHAAQTVRQRFRELEQQVRTVICLSGIGRVISLLVGGIILYGLVDWMLRLDDSGTRLLFGLALAGGVGWLIWRQLWLPLTEQRSHAALAELLERRRPFIGNQLSSAAEFLEHRLDPKQGSPLLQQAVIDQAEHRLESLDWETVLDRRDVRRQALLAAGICGLALAIVVCFPTEAATAVTRLLFPFRQTPWPRRVLLQFVEHDLAPWGSHPPAPRRIVQGDSLELYVRNLKGDLPHDVQLEYRLGDDQVIREPLRKTILRDESGRPVDVAGMTFRVTRGPLELRAIGGDDDLMPFVPIEVVLPPEIADLQVRLEPPGYTGRPAEDLPPGTGDIVALSGAKVHWKATSSQPLSSATVVFQTGQRTAMELSGGGRELSLALTLNDARITSYRLELLNQDGFGSGERSPLYTVRLMQDQVPQVTLEEPSGDVTATADAVLPVRALLKDDLGLSSAQLVYAKERTQAQEFRDLAIYADHPLDDRLTTDWALAELELAAGDRLQFLIEAADTYDLGPAHVGRSSARTITIVGGEEKREELTDRMGQLLSDLSESIAVQRRIAEQTRQLQDDLKVEPRVRTQDADQLRKLDLEQQQVLRQLIEQESSVRAQAERLLEEFNANHLSNSETTKQLEAVSETLSELGREALPELQRGLTRAQKQAGNSPQTPAEPLVAELEPLTKQQAAALSELEKLEAELSDWRDRRHIAQELSDLIEGQRAVNRGTRAAAEQQLSGEQNAQGPPRKELEKLAQKQRSQADAIEQFRKDLDETIQAKSDADPAMAERLSKLSQDLDQAHIGDDLREAAELLRDRRPLQASSKQETGLKKLEELENFFQERPTDDQELLVKQMKSLEAELETLQKAEEQLAKDFEAAASQPQSIEQEETLQQLQQRQAELREELAEIERQLERLELKRPRDAARRAGERMEQLSEQKQTPQQRSESLQEAMDDLEQSRRELAQERRQAEEELAFEQLLKLQDELRGLAVRQTGVFDEVKRLDGLRDEEGKLSRAKSRTLKQTADTERELATVVEGLAKRMESVEALALTLRKLNGRMADVAGKLEELHTDEPVQHSLQAIADQIQRLLTVMDSSASGDNQAERPNAEETQQPPEKQAAGPPGDVITLIAQLELLKDLQEDCRQRTQEIQQARGETAELTAEQTAELESLERDQTQLTDLARNLLTRLLQSEPPVSPAEPSTEGQ